ncbi:MAG: MarR family transcriptional regulator, partial [Christensenellales bacterium]
VELRLLPKSNVSVAVESLIQRGLLCRRQDTTDRRRIHLSLTNSAPPLLEDVLSVMPRFTACALSGFTAEETRDFEQFYTRIAQNISLCLQKEGTFHE